MYSNKLSCSRTLRVPSESFLSQSEPKVALLLICALLLSSLLIVLRTPSHLTVNLALAPGLASEPATVLLVLVAHDLAGSRSQPV